MMAAVDIDGFGYFLRIGHPSSGLYRLDPLLTTDSGANIVVINRFAFTTFDEGAINFFEHLRFRVNGSGNLNLILYTEDDVISTTLSSLSLSSSTGKELDRKINFQNEKMSVAINSVSKFTLQRLDIFGTPMWSQRPS